MLEIKKLMKQIKNTLENITNRFDRAEEKNIRDGI